VILIASGSEVQIILEAKTILNGKGVNVRVISMPSTDVFDQQTKGYRSKLLPADIPVRIAIEAGATSSLCPYIGDHGEAIGLDHFGASGPYDEVYKGFGLTATKVASKARAMLKKQEK
jgi:transketolase